MTFKILFLIFSFPIMGFAAVENEGNNFNEIKRKLVIQNKFIQEMNSEVGSVEMNLGLQNKKYLRLSGERAKLEDNLNSARKNADLDNQILKKNYSETKMILMGVLLNKLEKAESSADLLSRKILVENLRQKLLSLDGIMKNNKAVRDDVENLYIKLENSMKTEKELLSIMGELEQKKKNLHLNIENENIKRTDTQGHYDDVKNKIVMERESLHKSRLKEKLQPLQITEEIKIPSQTTSGVAISPSLGITADFSLPLSIYQGMDYQKKGVTLNFQGKNEVFAPKAGKIVYTGSLANYGNVLMIDHGNDTRTVLLGQFDYIVKNGDLVKVSQVVGHTNPRSQNGIGDGKIYFEVRKNNLTQNTYLLLDKKRIANNLSK